MKSGLLCHKQVWRAGTSNCIPQYLWDVITCPCPSYLLVAQQSSHVNTCVEMSQTKVWQAKMYCTIENIVFLQAKLKHYKAIMNEGDFMKNIARIALLRLMEIIIMWFTSVFKSCLLFSFFAISQWCDRLMIDENHNWWKALEVAV